MVQSGVDEGAELLLDGRDLVVQGYEKGNFVGPTVLHKVKVCIGFLLLEQLDALVNPSSFDN